VEQLTTGSTVSKGGKKGGGSRAVQYLVRATVDFTTRHHPPTASTSIRHLLHISPSATAHPSIPNHIASPPLRISVKESKMTSRIPNPSSTNAPRLSTAPSSIKPRQLVCLPPLLPPSLRSFSSSPPRHSLPQDIPPAMEAVLSPPTPNHPQYPSLESFRNLTIFKHPANQENKPTNALQSHLHAQLAQLSANLADLENLLRMTSVQAESVRGLGAWHGGLYISPSFLPFLYVPHVPHFVRRKERPPRQWPAERHYESEGMKKERGTKANVGGK
jgi:hypothetical protein